MDAVTTPPQTIIPQTSRLEGILSKYPIIYQLLRFGAIGVINTAIDFIILNFLSKLLGINAGNELGALNVISFSLAVVQSYYWNKYWTFGSTAISLVTNVRRLILVGGIGSISVLAVLIGAKFSASPIVYFIILCAFIIAQLSLWIAFKLTHVEQSTIQQGSKQFLIFVIVSIIGLLINSILVSVLSTNIPQNDFINSDLAKNLAKIVATGASLIWNFVGYKLFVFRK